MISKPYSEFFAHEKGPLFETSSFFSHLDPSFKCTPLSRFEQLALPSEEADAILLSYKGV
jgi:hypothetical protein